MSESKPYFPPATRVIGVDTPSKCVLTIYGESGAGKSHFGYQLIQDSEYGKEEVLFIKREEASATYGEGAHVVDVDLFADVKKQFDGLIEAQAKGARLPKVIFIDSWSGLAHATQDYYREHPVEEWNDKRGEFVRNKYAEYAEIGSQSIGRLLKAGRLNADIIVLCTTSKPPGGQPELALPGKMIPSHLSQFSTSSLYLVVEPIPVVREQAEKSKADGSLMRPHRIVEPWKDSDLVVPVISRFLYSQNTGEVIAKGHRNLRVKEPAYLPRILRRIHGRSEPKESPYFEGAK